MQTSKYRFTIFTPCYNSEKFIHRVIESLESQTFKDFEWLVINDASKDNTHAIIEAYLPRASFPVQYYNLQQNQMLSKNFNMAFEKAQGELMVFAGHDDRFDAETLQVFDETWKRLGNDDISGIWCRCRDQHGNPVGNEFPQAEMVSNYFTLFMDHIYTQERFGCTRTAVLNQYRFDTSESNYISEGSMWGKIGLSYNTIYLNRILRTYYIEADNAAAMTKSGRAKYAGASYYDHTLWVNQFNKKVKGHLKYKLRHHFGAVFYGIVAGKNMSAIISNVKPVFSKLLCTAMYPAVWLLYKKMKASGKGL